MFAGPRLENNKFYTGILTWAYAKCEISFMSARSSSSIKFFKLLTLLPSSTTLLKRLPGPTYSNKFKNSRA
jgi:hypothetical protein